MQFAVYISDTPVTLKQSQGHQAWNENVDLKQGYNHAKFERSCFNSVGKKSQHFKKNFKGDNMSIISLEHVHNHTQWYVHNLLDAINNHTKFQLNQIRR